MSPDSVLLYEMAESWTLTPGCFPEHCIENSIYLPFPISIKQISAKHPNASCVQRDTVSICSLNRQEIALPECLQDRVMHKHFLQWLIRFLWFDSNGVTVLQPLLLTTSWKILERVQRWWKTRCDSRCPTDTGRNCLQRHGEERLMVSAHDANGIGVIQ